MRLTALALFAAGYLIGARAGRERYAQIVALAEGTSRRLEEFSERHPPGAGDNSARRTGGRA